MTVEESFAVLQLTRGSSQHDIQEAYRKLALELHPDSIKGDGAEMKRLNLAREVASQSLLVTEIVTQDLIEQFRQATTDNFNALTLALHKQQESSEAKASGERKALNAHRRSLSYSTANLRRVRFSVLILTGLCGFLSLLLAQTLSLSGAEGITVKFSAAAALVLLGAAVTLTSLRLAVVENYYQNLIEALDEATFCSELLSYVTGSLKKTEINSEQVANLARYTPPSRLWGPRAKLVVLLGGRVEPERSIEFYRQQLLKELAPYYVGRVIPEADFSRIFLFKCMAHGLVTSIGKGTYSVIKKCES